MKLKTLFITLLLLLILSACQTLKENQSSNNLVTTAQPTYEVPYVPESVKSGCHTETARTLEPFKRIEPNMSFNAACTLIGLPDQEVGSGLHIFVYHLEDDSRILVGFASYDRPMLYLVHRMPDGTEELLTKSEPNAPSATSKPIKIITFSFADSSQHAGSSKYFTLFFKDNTLVIWDDINTDLYDIDWQILDLSQLLGDNFHYISSLAYAPYEDDLIIVFVKSNVESSGSSIARINGDTLQPKWVSKLFGFNVGQPIIRNGSLYVTAIGTVGKVDIESGDYIWKHEDLYDHETQDFNNFKMPIFSENKIIFQGHNITSSCPKRIEIDDNDGTILAIVGTCFP